VFVKSPNLFSPLAQPLIVSYGAGVDSTAMLVALHKHGIRPDLIMFADTGAEKPETYAYLPIMDAWLAKVGFPAITVVKYKPVRAPYNDLEGKCLANETLPSLAYGGHSCSMVFKGEPQDKFVKSWQPALDAWKLGMPVLRCIGYDNGAQDRKRREKADRYIAKMAAEGKPPKYANVYPLQDWTYPLQTWGLDRVACLALIANAGLPLPVKSACYFCPAMKKSEIVALRDTHPVLFHRALAIEAKARDGKHTFVSVKGLGRNFAWADLAHVKADEVVDQAACLQP
jgi:hypothetical protein